MATGSAGWEKGECQSTDGKFQFIRMDALERPAAQRRCARQHERTRTASEDGSHVTCSSHDGVTVMMVPPGVPEHCDLRQCLELSCL